MAKAQGKKATAAGRKGAVKKAVARVKSAVVAAKKKVAMKKPSKPAKPVAKKKPAPKAARTPVKPAAKAAKPALRSAKPARPARPAKAVARAAKPGASAAKPASRAAKPVAKAAKPAAKAAKPVQKAVKTAAKAVKQVAKKIVPAVAPKAEAPPKSKLKVKAVKPAPATSPVAPKVPAVPKPAGEPEKKRGRRARPRVISNGAPTASWLSSEKPRPASFIAAPARAEAPSAVAAPPASSDRLIREDDLAHPAVRTVPIRIDVEQGAGRFYVIANPMETTVRVGEGIEWDFRYIGGADVNVEEVVIEFEKPSPFADTVFRTRKPGGARPHRQLSGGAVPAAAGRRVQYTVRAVNQFKTELANAKIFVTITA